MGVNRFLPLFLILVLMSGCGSSRKMNKSEKAGVGAIIGSWVGELFGRGVGSAIDSDNGEEIGGIIGAMAGGAAGSTIAYNKAEREDAAKLATSNDYKRSASLMAIPLLKIENCYVGDDVSANEPLYGGKDYELKFDIVNNGNYAALDVVPDIKVVKNASKVELQEIVPVGDIPARGKITYKVRMKTSPKLKCGKVVFSVSLKERKGFGTDYVKFEMQVGKHKPL